MNDTADKRPVTTDALQTLGSIIGESEARDAIHLAVEPVVAAHALRPGEDVGFIDGGVGVCTNPVGIVDPFLKSAVQKGQRFWLVVYPRQITSLRHVWEHPAFPVSVDVHVSKKRVEISPSERWLRDFAAKLPVHYEDLLAHAKYYLDSNGYEYWSEGGRFEGVSTPDEFWDHYENVTGTKAKIRGGFFSCSC